MAEHVEPWSLFTFLKSRGWKGIVEGSDSSNYSVGPLARLNAAAGMDTPKAQAAYTQMCIAMANMVVATGNNTARIAMSVERAAKGLIKGGNVTEGLLNKVEMAFRAYDPCLGCATHSLPGHLPLSVKIFGPNRQLVQELKRG
ncbi:MAG: hypothetical protein HZA90_09980 [Verrucomicrobia bacterium]|nr:hypothetical protein [Verrucomicrobiota bacterium]